MSEGNVKPFVNRYEEQAGVDVFAEAAANANANPAEEREPANQNEDLPEFVSEEAPEPVAKPKVKFEKVKSGRGPAYVAIAMSAIAIGVAGYSAWSQQGMQIALTEQIDSLKGYTINTRMIQDSIVKRQEQTTVSISKNTQSIQSISDIRSDLLIYNAALEQMKGEVVTIRGSVAKGQTALGEQRTAIEILTDRVGFIEDEPVKKVTRVITPKKTNVPNPKVDSSKIEGSSLASIDAWGSQINVMLRDENGNWIPLSQGDFYKGWQLVSVSDNKATFKEDKRILTLKIEG
jgi:hypothetical protein